MERKLRTYLHLPCRRASRKNCIEISSGRIRDGEGGRSPSGARELPSGGPAVPTSGIGDFASPPHDGFAFDGCTNVHRKNTYSTRSIGVQYPNLVSPTLHRGPAALRPAGTEGGALGERELRFDAVCEAAPRVSVRWSQKTASRPRALQCRESLPNPDRGLGLPAVASPRTSICNRAAPTDATRFRSSPLIRRRE